LSKLAVSVPANTTARVYVPAASAGETFVANGGATYVGYQNGAQVYDVAAGSTTFVHGTTSDVPVGGSVPATLSLSLGAPATFGTFTAGADRTYTASTTANVISTAGDAALTVSSPAYLANGAFTLAEPLQVAFSKSSWSAPVSNDPVTIDFRQHIGANDPLRTGSYSKTLTFTLSTTTP